MTHKSESSYILQKQLGSCLCCIINTFAAHASLLTVKNNRMVIYFFALLAMLFWGLSFIWSTIVFEYYKPVTTVFLRLVMSSAIFWILKSVFRHREVIQRQHYKLFILSALFNPFLYFIGENFGLKMTSPTLSAVIIATIPLFTPFVGVLLLKEKLSPLNYVGMIISFAGILVMLLKSDLTLIAPPLGLAFLAFAVASAVAYSVFLKKLSAHYSAITIIATQNVLGALYFMPFFLLIDFNHFVTVIPDKRLVMALLQLAVFASSLAYVLYTMVTRQLGISRTNIFTNLIPVFTAVFSYFILKEIITVNKILGIILVISGVVLSQRNQLIGIKGRLFDNKLNI